MGPTKSRNYITSCLYLHAVLPAFEELSHVSPQARSLIEEWDCSVEFAVRGGSRAAVSFKGGAVSVQSERCLNPAISLFFLSSRQLVNQFSGKGFTAPLLRRGVFRLACVHRFAKLGTILQEELEQHPRLLLSVALASLKPLSEHDPKSQALLQAGPEGLAEFCVPSSKLFGWVEWNGGRITWGRGHAPRAADVVVSFRNEAIALAGLRGELDELAAVGSGDVTVRGLVPLAETLGHVMGRTSFFLDRHVPSR